MSTLIENPFRIPKSSHCSDSMDINRSNPLDNFASSPMNPLIPSRSVFDLQKRAFNSNSYIAPFENDQGSFSQSNYQNPYIPEDFQKNSFSGLLNSPLDFSGSTHLGFEEVSPFNSLENANTFSLSGKPNSKSPNEVNLRVNDGHLVHDQYHNHYPIIVGFHDYAGKVPFQLVEEPLNQVPALQYKIRIPEKPIENVVDEKNVCSHNDYEGTLTENLSVANDSKLDTPRKKNQSQIKGKRKAARESSLEIVKGHWSPKEDQLLLQQVERFGVGRWKRVAKHIKGREGKQCRERWFNYLRPDIKNESWTEVEDEIIIDAYKKMGSKWSVMQNLLPGRTENSVKNHWNTVKRRVENRLAATGRSSNTARKNTLLEKFILSLISSQSGNKRGETSYANTAEDHDSTEDEEEDEEFDDQQEEVDLSVIAAGEESCQVPCKHIGVKEDQTNHTFADYYKVGPPLVQDDQQMEARGSSNQFENLDPAMMQQLKDFDMWRLINNEEIDWKAEYMDLIKMLFPKDV